MAQVSMINIDEMDSHQVNTQFINLFMKMNKILQTVLLPWFRHIFGSTSLSFLTLVD